jgi:hypothetical protein
LCVVQVLDDDKGQPATVRDMAEELLQRLQPARGGADADDRAGPLLRAPGRRRTNSSGGADTPPDVTLSSFEAILPLPGMVKARESPHPFAPVAHPLVEDYPHGMITVAPETIFRRREGS